MRWFFSEYRFEFKFYSQQIVKNSFREKTIRLNAMSDVQVHIARGSGTFGIFAALCEM